MKYLEISLFYQMNNLGEEIVRYIIFSSDYFSQRQYNISIIERISLKMADAFFISSNRSNATLNISYPDI